MQTLMIPNRHLYDLNPVNGGWQVCPPGHSYGPAIREYFLFHYVVSGEGVFRRAGETVKIKGGSIFLIRPGETCFYQADADNPWTYIWIGFDGVLCREMIGSTSFGSDNAVLEAPYLAPVFERVKQMCKQTQGVELSAAAMLYDIFAKLTENHRTGQRRSDYVARTAGYIRNNYAMPVAIASIASMIGIDRRYLCRIFSEKIGMTPKEYLVSIRLERAAELLRSGSISVGDIARSVGYEDVFNFSKMFKKKFGVSPLEYKTLAQQNEESQRGSGC